MFSSSKALFFAAAALAAAVSSTHAFQQDAGPVCTTAPGTSCTWSYSGQDVNGNPVDVTVNANCGPIRADGNSYCADNGAQCTTDDNCYQYCGTNGICGGVGATCYDQGPNEPNSSLYICNGPSTICSTNCHGDTANCGPGTCLLGASQAAGFRKVNRNRRDFAAEARHLALRRAASVVARPGDEQLA